MIQTNRKISVEVEKQVPVSFMSTERHQGHGQGYRGWRWAGGRGCEGSPLIFWGHHKQNWRVIHNWESVNWKELRPEAVTTSEDWKRIKSHCQHCHHMTFLLNVTNILKKKKNEKSKGLGFPCSSGIKWARTEASYSCLSVPTHHRISDQGHLLSHSLLARKSQPWVDWSIFQGSKNWRQGRA